MPFPVPQGVGVTSQDENIRDQKRDPLIDFDVPADGVGHVAATPPPQLRAPRQVRLGRPQLHVLVEDLVADSARIEHLSAVQDARAVASEHLGRRRGVDGGHDVEHTSPVLDVR